jgi:hypothetical protein
VYFFLVLKSKRFLIFISIRFVRHLFSDIRVTLCKCRAQRWGAMWGMV